MADAALAFVRADDASATFLHGFALEDQPYGHHQNNAAHDCGRKNYLCHDGHYNCSFGSTKHCDVERPYAAEKGRFAPKDLVLMWHRHLYEKFWQRCLWQ